MGAAVTNRSLPNGAVIGVVALVAASLLLVAVARLTGYEPARPPPSAVVQRSELQFKDRADGAVLVYANDSDRLVDVLQPGTNGFVRGVLRGLVRERRARAVGPVPPFTLTRWSDGRLSLDDTATGRHIDLEVFGPTNAGAFADILLASARSGDKT